MKIRGSVSSHLEATPSENVLDHTLHVALPHEETNVSLRLPRISTEICHTVGGRGGCARSRGGGGVGEGRQQQKTKNRVRYGQQTRQNQFSNRFVIYIYIYIYISSYMGTEGLRVTVFSSIRTRHKNVLGNQTIWLHTHNTVVQHTQKCCSNTLFNVKNSLVY